MAEDLRSMISEEMLSCQICFEAYREPKTLPCLHSFCKGCLTNYVKKRLRSDIFAHHPCPICRTDFIVPENGVDGLKTNFNLLNLADMVGGEKPKPTKKEEICECCDAKKTAASYCEECEEKLCSDCVDAHRRVKVTRNHSVKPIPNAEDNTLVDTKTDAGEQLENNSSEWMCEKHPHQKIICICEQDGLPLCPFCISYILTSKSHAHKKHDFLGLDDAMAKFHSNIDSSLEQLREKVLDLEDGIDTLRETEAILTESHDAVKADIGNRAKLLQSAIADWKTMLDEDLSVEFKKNMEELSGKKGLLESYLKTVNDGTRQVNDVISSKDVMVIQRKEELMKKMKVVNMSVTYDMNSLLQPVKFTLVGAEAGDFKDKVPMLLGMVRTEKTARLQRFDSMSSVDSFTQEKAFITSNRQPGKPRLHKNQLYSVFIKNIPRKTRVSDFKTKIRQLQVRPLKIEWRGSQGYAFLKFDEFSKAHQCVQLMQDFIIDGKQLVVQLSNKNDAMPENE